MAASWPEHKKVQLLVLFLFEANGQIFEATKRFARQLKMGMWLYHLRDVEWDVLQTGRCSLLFFRDVNISMKGVVLCFYKVENLLKQLYCRDYEPGEVILQDVPLLVTKDGEKVACFLIEGSVKRCAL